MKTSKALYIQFESWTEFKARVKTALRRKTPTKTRGNALIFSSPCNYQKFMTQEKVGILAAIVQKKPRSICELARLVESDVAKVQRDCVALQAMGFIKFEDSGDAQRSKKPKLPFNYQKIVVCLPKVTYTHDFEEAL